VEQPQVEAQLLKACRRLAAKGFFNTPADSFSMRLRGRAEMILASGLDDWLRIGAADIRFASFACNDGLAGLHASIYRERADAGAVAISSPKGARLLALYGGPLPPVFDEQVRHTGVPVKPLRDVENSNANIVGRTLRRGTNATLLGEQLLCLGMTCERVLLNTELYEKCALAFVVAKASGSPIKLIPSWVRMVANRRLLQDERRAAESYRSGCILQDINAY
jgi:ribulose-5-phosphate 4-epimerase/fuculose-1-phosphate aldolase